MEEALQKNHLPCFQNRMIESMQLFNSICNSTWFLSTAMILFMNKKDLFMEKIQRVNITTAFPDYEGGQNYEEAVSFIKQKFAELNLNPDKKTIYMHETCATDTNQVQQNCPVGPLKSVNFRYNLSFPASLIPSFRRTFRRPE